MLRQLSLILCMCFFMVAIYGCDDAEQLPDNTRLDSHQSPRTIRDGYEDESDWVGKSYYRHRTVFVLGYGMSQTCSGTLLLPNVVLTARHCATTNHELQGEIPVDDSYLIRVRLLEKPYTMSHTYPDNDKCVGPTRKADCASVKQVHFVEDDTVDMVVLELEDPITLLPEMQPAVPEVLSTPLPTQIDLSSYLNTEQLVSGYGHSDIGDGSTLGILRWGMSNLAEVDGTAIKDGIERAHMMRLVQGSTGQLPLAGDSGGPTWSDTMPAAVIGVHSFGIPNFNAKDIAVAHPFHLGSISSWMNALTTYEFARDLSSLDQVDIVATDSAADWRIVNGQLTQTAVAATSFALVTERAVHGVVNQSISAKATGPNNGGGGIVFNYFDEDNFLACAANDQFHAIGLLQRYQGDTTFLSTASWGGDYSQEVTFRVASHLNENNEIDYTCQVWGGGAATATASGQSPILGAGRVGVFNGNPNLSYADLTVEKQGACNEVTATDLGSTGTPMTVPADGCVKITAYPSWWATRTLNFQSMETGDFPVPFTWTNSCGAGSGTDTFTQSWQHIYIGGISDACTTVIDLQGAEGGSIKLNYFGL